MDRTLLPDRVILLTRTMVNGAHPRAFIAWIRLHNPNDKRAHLLWHEAMDISLPQWT
jgi:hypothetical protein